MAISYSLLDPAAATFVPGRVAHPVEDYPTASKRSFEQQLVAARNRALANEFSYHFGTGTNDLVALQSLCYVCGVRPVPFNRDDCKKILRNTHVNLFDVVEARRYGGIAKGWTNKRELQRHCRETGRIFLVEEAREGTLLRHFLNCFQARDETAKS